MRRFTIPALVTASLVLIIASGGCEGGSSPPSTREHQDAELVQAHLQALEALEQERRVSSDLQGQITSSRATTGLLSLSLIVVAAALTGTLVVIIYQRRLRR